MNESYFLSYKLKTTNPSLSQRDAFGANEEQRYIQMPDMNGYEATRQIRAFSKQVVIIAQTAYALPGDCKKAIESGCNEYFSKPIDKALLMNLIKKYFEKQANGH